MSNDETIAQRMMFRDHATFDISDKVNRHYFGVWDTENHAVVDLGRDFPKGNAYLAMLIFHCREDCQWN
jgi:hypothetical protein